MFAFRVRIRIEPARKLSDLDLPHENLYIDRCSWKDLAHPELKNLARSTSAADFIHVHSLDRLANNLKDLLEIVNTLIREFLTGLRAKAVYTI